MSKPPRPAPRPARRRGPSAPEDWTRIGAGGPAPFVSWVTYRRADGSQYTWRARQHRKGAGPQLYPDRLGLRTTRRGEPRSTASPWRRWWAPHRLAWWIAITFIVGTALFVAGAAGSLAPSLFGGQHRMSIFAESCYFTGAALFTVAVYAQLLEGINADERIGPTRDSYPPGKFRWFIPRLADLARLEILTAVVFLVGSVTFNYETTFSLGSLFGLLPRAALWDTTMIGSIVFLLASLLQFFEVSHRYLGAEVRDVSWWIGVLFIIGSICFIVGSLPGLGTPGMPDSHVDAGALIVKLGFLAGGLAYLAGSYLMLPELFIQLRSHPPAATSAPERPR